MPQRLVDGERAERARDLSEDGPRADLPRHVECTPDGGVEERFGARGIDRAAKLTDHLAFALDQRVESGGDAEEVSRRCLSPKQPQAGRPFGHTEARQDRLIIELRFHNGVDLDAMAGRKDERGQRRCVSQCVDQPLAHVDRRIALAQRCDDEGRQRIHWRSPLRQVRAIATRAGSLTQAPED